jgi:putative N6-adenine-specific DNA methylase
MAGLPQSLTRIDISVNKDLCPEYQENSFPVCPFILSISELLMKNQNRYFCICNTGLEHLVLNELRLLKIHGIPEKGGIEFTGTERDLVQTNLCLRTASRILQRIALFPVTGFDGFEKQCRRIRWDRFLSPAIPIDIRVESVNSRLYHERAIKERLMRWLQDDFSVRPAVEGESAQRIYVRIVKNRCTISIDTSGDHLHRRGYRLQTAKAPLRENLAAAMVLASGWARNRPPLYDPFCGSGTILIEAALIAKRIVPGLVTERTYAFQSWPDASKHIEHLAELREHWKGQIRAESQPFFFGSDRDAGAIQAAKENARRADLSIEWQQCSFSDVSYQPDSFLLCNPPYGQRIGEDLRNLYAALGGLARCRPDLTIAWLSSDPRWQRATGMAWKKCLHFSNGGLPVKLLRNR